MIVPSARIQRRCCVVFSQHKNSHSYSPLLYWCTCRTRARIIQAGIQISKTSIIPMLYSPFTNSTERNIIEQREANLNFRARFHRQRRRAWASASPAPQRSATVRAAAARSRHALEVDAHLGSMDKRIHAQTQLNVERKLNSSNSGPFRSRKAGFFFC